MNAQSDPLLQAARIVDSDHAAVIAFAREVIGAATTPRDKAVKLYYAVRDRFRYDPYSIDLSDEGLKASSVIALGHGWCVSKSALLTAACRVVGIPAKVGFADVRNHLSTQRMRDTMKTDVFYWHGYTSILIDGKWLKATPAFNIELTRKFALKPLDFDGSEDSIYHAHDLAGNRHMEYLRQRGEFADVPVNELRADFAALYPQMPRLDSANFDADVAKETGAR